MNTVWRVFAYLKRYPVLGISMMACAIVGTLMMFVFPGVIRKGIDEVIVGHHPEHLLPLVLLAAVALSSSTGLNSLRLLLNNTFEQKVIFDLRSDLYSHIQLLPLRWFDNRATGDLMTRDLEDVTSVERVLIDGIEQGRWRYCKSSSCSRVMFYLSAKLRSSAWLRCRFWLVALVVHAYGTSALSTATPRRLRHEFAFAR